jgi:molybdate transport system substrate-binding protein
MNTKLIAIAAIIIMAVASSATYLVYNGALTSNPSSTPTSPPSPTTSPTATPTLTVAPTHSTSTTLPSASPTKRPHVTDSPTPSPTPEPVTLRIFMASSLYQVVNNMSSAFEQANNCDLIINSGSSSALYTQITAGSPCDVFMSADQKWTKNLNNSGLTIGSYQNFTTNSLEMIIAEGNPKGITSLADLTKSGVKVVLADPAIPSGSYTNTTCYKIDNTWGNPSSSSYISNGSYVNFNATMHQNVVSYETTVENVVGKVSLNVGTADAGIVFVSDAVYGQMSGSQVTFIPIPASVNTKGTYGITVTPYTSQTSAQIALAQKFMVFWSSTEGQVLLTQFGFNS